MDEEYMLTTYDNPFNPFTQWDSWYNEDRRLGYDTSGFLGRLAATADGLPDATNQQEIYKAMDRIIALEPMTYVKVRRDGSFVKKEITNQ